MQGNTLNCVCVEGIIDVNWIYFVQFLKTLLNKSAFYFLHDRVPCNLAPVNLVSYLLLAPMFQPPKPSLCSSNQTKTVLSACDNALPSNLISGIIQLSAHCQILKRAFRDYHLPHPYCTVNSIYPHLRDLWLVISFVSSLGQGLCRSSSPYTQDLQHCLAHSRHSLSICCMN